MLSPSVEAMKTSASSMPASVSASISIAVTDREAPARVLPDVGQAGVEALVRQRVLVEDGDRVPGGQRGLGDGGADATRPDDENHHEA